MSFDHVEIVQLKAVVAALQKIITTSERKAVGTEPKRYRRSGKELSAFRKLLRTELLPV
jgi:hypothetical protein